MLENAGAKARGIAFESIKDDIHLNLYERVNEFWEEGNSAFNKKKIIIS